MKELENLLTSLVGRGWKPKDREVVSIKLDQEFTKSEGKTVFYCSCKDGFGFYADLRWLVSVESGLWQFLCERDLLKTIGKVRAKEPSMSALRLEFENLAFSFEPEYWLLESALIPEKELGQFLVENTVIVGK
ncbi:MAG: hypothetical protein ACFNWZ_00895 [Candidatus Absconditicoccaceae bacterium]